MDICGKALKTAMVSGAVWLALSASAMAGGFISLPGKTGGACWKPVASTSVFGGGIMYGCVIDGVAYPQYSNERVCAEHCRCTATKWVPIGMTNSIPPAFIFACQVNGITNEEIHSKSKCLSLNTCDSITPMAYRGLE